MSKIAIITLADFNNYGNRLQNYALEKVLTEMGNTVTSIVPYKPNLVKGTIKTLIRKDNENLKIKCLKSKRLKEFIAFDKQYVHTYAINSDNFENIPEENYDCFISGSDQVWNPDWADYTYNKTFLRFCQERKRISYAASFGVDSIPEKWIEKYRVGLSEFRYLSVREKTAVEIVADIIGKPCNRVLDPTMLLNKSEWDKIAKVSTKDKRKKYILTYFLGGKSDELNIKILEYARRFECDVINMLDINDSAYMAGPDKFVGLISKAELVLTDSFHATVFSILYERPFVVYNRQGIGSKMGSRLSSLLEMCALSDRKSDFIDEKKLLICDFTSARKKIEREKIHSIDFLQKSIKGCVDSVG